MFINEKNISNDVNKIRLSVNASVSTIPVQLRLNHLVLLAYHDFALRRNENTESIIT